MAQRVPLCGGIPPSTRFYWKFTEVVRQRESERDYEIRRYSRWSTYSAGWRQKLTVKGAWRFSASCLNQELLGTKRYRISVHMASQPSEWRIFLPPPTERG